MHSRKLPLRQHAMRRCCILQRLGSRNLRRQNTNPVRRSRLVPARDLGGPRTPDFRSWSIVYSRSVVRESVNTSKDTMAMWRRDVLKGAGVDTHSTRTASTSAALSSRGVQRMFYFELLGGTPSQHLTGFTRKT